MLHSFPPRLSSDLLLTLLFALANTFFAVVYLLCGPGALATPATGMPEGQFGQAFFFSVETFATIGYGNIYPIGVAANIVMTIESIAGLLGVALATGIIFARFSRPVARLRFSRRALIAPYRGITAFLVERGWVNQAQIDEALRTQGFFGGQLESHLLKLGYDITEHVPTENALHVRFAKRR